MRLRVVLEPSDEDGYTVYVPALPGCIRVCMQTSECHCEARSLGRSNPHFAF
jgi:hypothetical protein